MSYLPPTAQKNNIGEAVGEAFIGGFFGLIFGLVLMFSAVILYGIAHADFATSKIWVMALFQGFFVEKIQSVFFLAHVFSNNSGALGALESWQNFKQFGGWIYYLAYFLLVAPAISLSIFFGHKKIKAGGEEGVGAGEIHLSGLKFIEKPRQALKVLSRSCVQACKKSKPGVCIHPNNGKPISITERSESAHFFYIGKSGSGKTQSMQHVLRSAINRDDKIMIYDFKSDDFSGWFADRYRKDAVLLAPWDQRTAIWDIAADIEYLSDTTLLSKSLLPSSDGGGDEYWSLASRDILTAVLKYLRKEFGTNWGFAQLSMLFSDLELLKIAVRSVDSGCADAHLGGDDGEQSSQTQGVQGSLRKCGEWMTQIAALWPRTPETKNRMFSIRKYVHGTGRGKNQKIVVLGGNERFTFFSPILASIASLYIAYKISAKAGAGGRQWLFLDELGTLPKLENLVIGMTNARSKGLRFVLGIQDLGVLKNVYGENLTATIVNNPGTIVAGAATDPSTQDLFSKIFGTKIVERNQATLQANQGGGSSGALGAISGDGINASYSWQKSEESVVHAGIIAHLQPLNLLIKTPDMADHVCVIKWDYEALPNSGEPILLREKKLKQMSWARPIDAIEKENKAFHFENEQNSELKKNEKGV